MPLPDNFNSQAFECAWGGEQTEAEYVWEAHAAKAHETVKLAYHQFPINSEFRRQMIARALANAKAALGHYGWLSANDSHRLLEIYSRIMECDAEDCQEGVAENVGDYFHVYSRAIERSQEEGL